MNPFFRRAHVRYKINEVRKSLDLAEQAVKDGRPDDVENLMSTAESRAQEVQELMVRIMGRSSIGLSVEDRRRLKWNKC